MPNTVVIRARPETRDLLNHLAREDGTTAIDTLERLIRGAAEARLLAALATDLAVPSASEGETSEEEGFAAWDATLEDGLEQSEDFSAWR